MGDKRHEIPPLMLESAQIIPEMNKLYRIFKEGVDRARHGGTYTSEQFLAEYRHFEAVAGWVIKTFEAAGVPEMAAQIAELEGELAQYQTSKFHPDWPVLQTTQENLRQAWARIRELEAELVRVREVLHEQTSYLEERLRNAVTGEGCPHGYVRPSQCVDCIKERG